MYDSYTCLLFHPLLDEVRNVQGLAWDEKLDGLSNEWQSHGTRREFAITFGIPPFVNPVSYADYKQGYNTEPNRPVHDV